GEINRHYHLDIEHRINWLEVSNAICILSPPRPPPHTGLLIPRISSTMTEWFDSKAFQRLWRSLTKAGWKARPPSGLDSEHTYVKPGVKGRLRKDKAGVEYFKGAIYKL
ncbi:hypothetical protein L915_02363, partial [Phytophthora nicotianae]